MGITLHPAPLISLPRQRLLGAPPGGRSVESRFQATSPRWGSPRRRSATAVTGYRLQTISAIAGFPEIRCSTAQVTAGESASVGGAW